jgi:ATP/maltotriose-dependent transcriptional regulator MalT
VRPILAHAEGRALAWACMPGAYSLARLGHIEQALDVARRGFQAHAALSTPTDWYPWMHAFYEAEALAHGGRFDEAETVATEQYRAGVEARSLEAQAMFSWHLSRSVADRGHVEEALRHSRKAVSIYRQLGRPQFVDFCLIYQTLGLAIARRPAEAEATMRSLERSGIARSYFMGVDLVLAQGWVLAAQGNLREARETFRQAAAEGEHIGDLVGALSALHNIARIGYPKEVSARVTDLAGEAEGELAAARRAHVSALTASEPDVLGVVSVQFERMGALLLAAEVAADASVAWGRVKDAREKASAERRCGWLAAQCPGARSPALLATESRARLTAAEWEAGQLAACGLSNREIADQLMVSIRTVENRLQHVYGKLGVRGRAELAQVLESIGGPSAGSFSAPRSSSHA